MVENSITESGIQTWPTGNIIDLGDLGQERPISGVEHLDPSPIGRLNGDQTTSIDLRGRSARQAQRRPVFVQHVQEGTRVCRGGQGMKGNGE